MKSNSKDSVVAAFESAGGPAITIGYPLHRKSCACPAQDVGPYQPSCLICHGREWFWDDACECVECCELVAKADAKANAEFIRNMEAA